MPQPRPVARCFPFSEPDEADPRVLSFSSRRVSNPRSVIAGRSPRCPNCSGDNFRACPCGRQRTSRALRLYPERIRSSSQVCAFSGSNTISDSGAPMSSSAPVPAPGPTRCCTPPPDRLAKSSPVAPLRAGWLQSAHQTRCASNHRGSSLRMRDTAARSRGERLPLVSG